MSVLRFLYRFGYESPAEQLSNRETGSDFESSSAIWIIAPSAEEALAWGETLADQQVSRLFMRAGQAGYTWRTGGFAQWIEYGASPSDPDYGSCALPTATLGQTPDLDAADWRLPD